MPIPDNIPSHILVSVSPAKNKDWLVVHSRVFWPGEWKEGEQKYLVWEQKQSVQFMNPIDDAKYTAALMTMIANQFKAFANLAETGGGPTTIAIRTAPPSDEPPKLPADLAEPDAVEDWNE